MNDITLQRSDSHPHLYGFRARGFNQQLANAARAIPGMTWDAGSRAWVGYADAAALVATDMRLGGAVDSVPKKMMHFRPNSYTPNLRGYQRDGVDFILAESGGGCILADEMGLGKTLQTITAARLSGAQRILICCPNYVRGVWVRELAKWWPEAGAPFLPKGVKRKNALPEQSPRIIICHYDILPSWAEALGDWLGGDGEMRGDGGFYILDEAHLLWGEKTARSKAARLIRTAAGWCVALTGTPMTNRPADLWNVVDIVSPGRFGKFFPYALRYCAAHKEEHPSRSVPGAKEAHWAFDGVSNAAELKERLSWFMLRRTKSDVALELPPKTRTRLALAMPSLAFRGATTGSAPSREETTAALQSAATAKLGAVLDILRDRLQAGDRIVVGAHRREIAETITAQLLAEGHRAAYIHGGVSLKARAPITAAFAESQEPSVLAVTFDAASVGIDLSYANVGVVAELTYRLDMLLQWESRMHRFGQQNPVSILYPLVEGSLEELVANALLTKLDAQEAIMPGGLDPADSSVREALAGAEEDVFAALAASIAARAAQPEQEDP